MKSIKVEELADISDALLIDVRSPVEYQSVHAESAQNMPLDELNVPDLISEAAGKSIYVICKSGQRGATACKKIAAAGYENVMNIEGGTDAWLSSGRTVVRGKSSVMSLERQVRIAAGFLVFIGSLLGIFVNEWFLGLPLFVGGGLVFAGISNFCGMGLLLARMPWNKVRG